MNLARLSLTLGLLLAVVAVVAVVPVVADAQEIPELRETIQLDFDRPEAWGMKYFSAAILPTEIVREHQSEKLVSSASLEIGWLPRLDLEQRTIGFDGLKEEDLNKLAILPRPSLNFTLPGDVTMSLGWVPPLEVEGLKANLISVSGRKRIASRGEWNVHLRAVGQTGDIRSDFTCPETVASHLPGSTENPWGCEKTSSDRYSIDQFSSEIYATRSLPFRGRPNLQVSAGAVWIDGKFEVDAIRTGFRDLTVLLADGTYWTGSIGTTWALSEIDVGLVATYSPISVQRPGHDSEIDPFFNLRIVLSRWR